MKKIFFYNGSPEGSALWRGMGRSPMLFIFFIFFIFPLLFPRIAFANVYDVVVVGAGTGGMSAAIQAARSGLSVAVVEPSDRVGGQIVASAVSTMDDVGRTRTGLYLEFIERVRAYYARAGVATNICLWGGDTIAVEPVAAERILLEMADEAGVARIVRAARIVRVEMEGDRVAGILVETGDGGALREERLSGKVFVEATEQGDFLAMTGARYRVGNSISPRIDERANVQDITYVAVVKRYPDGLPDALRMPGPPPG